MFQIFRQFSPSDLFRAGANVLRKAILLTNAGEEVRTSDGKIVRVLADRSQSLLSQMQTAFWGDTWYLFDPGASNAVYQDFTGLTPAAANDVVGLLIGSAKGTPEARINYFYYTDDLSASGWNRASVTLTKNATLSPDGSLVGNKISVTSNGSSTFSLDRAVVLDAKKTFALLVKEGEHKRVALGVTGSTAYAKVFDLTTLATLDVAGDSTWTGWENATSSGIESAGGGWYLIWITVPASATGGRCDFYLIENTSVKRTFTGVAGSGAYVLYPRLCLGTEKTYQRIDDYPYSWLNNAKAIQATTSNKPCSRKTSTTNRYWLDGNTSTAALTATLGNLGSNCTIARCGATGVTWLDSQTISSTLNIVTPYAYNGPVGVWNRALTTSEKALFEQWYATKKPTLGAELFTVNDFASDTGWAKGTGWSIGSGVATKSAGTASNIAQDVAANGKQILVKGTVTRSAGTVGAFNGTAQMGATNANASAEYAMVATSATIGFRGDDSFAGTLDDVSAREIL